MSEQGLRARVGARVESVFVQRTIMTLIAINAVTLGLETSPEVMAAFGEVLRTIDHFVLTIFVAEIGAKLFAKGLRFFRDPWNVFDFTVVTIALIPASGPLAVLRTLRVLRVLRLVSVMPRLRFVVEALLRAVPGISAIGGLMLLLFYVAAVMATGLFGADYPEWFGSVGASMYSLFQIMTLESWSMGIVRPVMEQYPYAWLFFVPFILIATFTMLNLFIAIIVDTMQTMHEQEMKEEHEVIGEVVHTESESIEGELRAMRQELRALRREISMENRS
ncbi:voltage-gated sodium channel [Thiohalomonas denitrificans]|uniref:Voltage-gated sodium channel n=2 Tax=Thiohalomonas denitrificans TaxID=415747 RepID=A0A1G5QI14_9GAMM|nr:ion transporter [Thiohalomonas denitrificans]SCZ61236.1 voltage-gated sodium channel [Thiohalomonas denitrificans]